MGFVVGGSVVWSLQPSAPPKTSQTSQQPGKKSAENSYLYDAWEWATHDATSVYTFFLALFTGVVGTTAIVQIRYLKRADETARISADAAKQAADAAVATERARFYVVIDHNFLECTNRAAAWDGPTDQEERPLPVDAQPMAGIKFKNYGKTPGFVDNVSTGIRYSETIPIPVF